MTKDLILTRGRWNNLKSTIDIPRGIINHINKYFNENEEGMELNYFEQIVMYLDKESFFKIKNYLDDFFKEDTKMSYQNIPLYKEDVPSSKKSDSVIIIEDTEEDGDEMNQASVISIIDAQIAKDRERAKKSKEIKNYPER